MILENCTVIKILNSEIGARKLEDGEVKLLLESKESCR
ncbi:hypothetical protein CWATWH0402_4537 [Crocosphaera watsonii WH 0402]|uniref:Uncharacterized protein n=1 Tax=Crocosphaera watsonii WH 0402 TaxID=1284629 RepID=T2JN82_CROWT|nr:hypothetical protein CWATWH0402_4537 [Crocosphaera watsonii WH 0402]